METILIVGGAGYIGSYMIKLLQKTESFRIVVLDNLSTGHREMIPKGVHLIFDDLSDKDRICAFLKQYNVTTVMHFASFISVSESVKKPALYYQNNVARTLNLLNSMIEVNIGYFIFSSSAAIFGNPQYTPIDCNHPCNPINPYGRSKYMIEQILDDYDHAYGLKSVCLRYFNAAGADPDGEIGEWHEPETHLIPLALQAASGRRSSITIFGKDYNTKDGTCIRDYIHIHDLCTAHQLALERLKRTQKSAKYNLGNGQGFSVKEVIDAAERVTGEKIKVEYGTRRAGDPAILIADSSLAERELHLVPQYASLDQIITHAWQWEQRKR